MSQSNTQTFKVFEQYGGPESATFVVVSFPEYKEVGRYPTRLGAERAAKKFSRNP